MTHHLDGKSKIKPKIVSNSLIVESVEGKSSHKNSKKQLKMTKIFKHLSSARNESTPNKIISVGHMTLRPVEYNKKLHSSKHSLDPSLLKVSKSGKSFDDKSENHKSAQNQSQEHIDRTKLVGFYLKLSTSNHY